MKLCAKLSPKWIHLTILGLYGNTCQINEFINYFFFCSQIVSFFFIFIALKPVLFLYKFYSLFLPRFLYRDNEKKFRNQNDENVRNIKFFFAVQQKSQIKVKCSFCVSTTICISKYFLMLLEFFFLFINKCSLNIFLYIPLLLLLLIHFLVFRLFIFHKIKQTMCFVSCFSVHP